MNERLERLAFKVMDEPVDLERTHLKIDVVRFAELIARECGQWFNNRLVVEPDYGMEHRIERNRAVVGVMKEYNTHFGVE